MQLAGIAVTWVFSGVGTYILIKLVDVLMGFRVTREEELLGLDLILHNEAAYPETLSVGELTGILTEEKVVQYKTVIHRCRRRSSIAVVGLGHRRHQHGLTYSGRTLKRHSVSISWGTECFVCHVSKVSRQTRHVMMARNAIACRG